MTSEPHWGTRAVIGNSMLALLHPLWGQISAYVSVNQDLSEDFEKETNRAASLEYARRNNVLEERIPISLLRAWGFRSPDMIELKFYSAALHPLPAGGYGVFSTARTQNGCLCPLRLLGLRHKRLQESLSLLSPLSLSARHPWLFLHHNLGTLRF